PCYAPLPLLLLFLCTDPAPPHFYTLPLHAALPISAQPHGGWTAGVACPAASRSRSRSGVSTKPAGSPRPLGPGASAGGRSRHEGDRKSTRLNSSHDQISYAVFCLKKKKTKITTHIY